MARTTVEVLKVMRSSKLFQPVNILPKTNIEDIKPSSLSKSQKLLLDLGIIRPSSNGFYHMLPLGVRSLNKLKSLIRRYLNNIDAQEIKMPLIVDGSLWKKSGRWEASGKEVYKFNDRGERDCILSPTNEESVTELFANLGQATHRQLPIILYQISSKFRDEIKPRCGLIKTKEFSMMDAYSFDDTIETAKITYGEVSNVFENIFNHLDLPFVKVIADPGDMGGDISHEYHVISDVGEDKLLICDNCNRAVNSEISSNFCSSCDCEQIFQKVTGIEVGHTFLLGTRYSAPFDCTYTTKEGRLEPVVMACYGLGLTRILAASLELFSTKEKIVWPSTIAPFLVCVIPPKEGSKEWDRGSVLSLDVCKELEKILPDDVLLDDRCDQTIGKRLRHAQRTGYPYVICTGKGSLASPPLFEVISSINNVTEHLTMPDLISFFGDFQIFKSKARTGFY